MTRQQLSAAVGQDLGVKNVHQTPTITHVTVAVGSGLLKGNESLQKTIGEGLARICGQKPVKTVAKKAIAGFKLRQGDHIGYKVTLRGRKMFDFLERIITAALPRLRDFQGLSLTGFDRQGNYSFGFKDQLIFPELPFDSHAQPWGMQVTIATSARTAQEAKTLLRAIGLPLQKEKNHG